MKPQRIISTEQPDAMLAQLLGEIDHDRLFVLADENTATHCVPLLRLGEEVHLITIAPGEENKHIETPHATHCWSMWEEAW